MFILYICTHSDHPYEIYKMLPCESLLYFESQVKSVPFLFKQKLHLKLNMNQNYVVYLWVYRRTQPNISLLGEALIF